MNPAEFATSRMSAKSIIVCLSIFPDFPFYKQLFYNFSRFKKFNIF